MNGVYWIFAEPPAGLRPVALAVVLCPRGGRHLAREMKHLKTAGIDTLVSLLSDEQVEMLDLAAEPLLATQLGMQFLHHPIPDHELPPDAKAFRSFVAGVAQRLREGQHVGVHCWGSIGRATVTAACTLIHLGWEPEKALAAVEAARGCPVPDTEEQERWILAYKANA